MVSGVSSVNVAPARLGLDLAQVVVSQHAKGPQHLPPAECSRHILVIPPPGGVQKVVEELRARVCEPVVLGDLNLPTERVAPPGEPSADLVIVAARCESARPT